MYLSVCPSIDRSIDRSIHPSIRLPIYRQQPLKILFLGLYIAGNAFPALFPTAKSERVGYSVVYEYKINQ